MTRPKTIHVLKTWPGYFAAILDGSKTFEVRKNDRNFQTGDVLILQEWEPAEAVYTGRSTARTVTYTVGGEWGIERGTVVMALGPLPDGFGAEIAAALSPDHKEAL